MVFDHIFERILKLYTHGIFSEEILKAKMEFFERSIPSLEDDASYFNLRMSQFHDWYIFTRKLTGLGMTPVEFGLQDLEFVRESGDKELFKSLLNHNHSLFEFVKARNTDVTVLDLFTNKKTTVKNSNIFAGFHKDELFSVRVIPYKDSYVFSKGFCLHPPDASDYLRREVQSILKKKGFDKEAALLKFTRMKYKAEQYKHILPKYIYTNEQTFRA